MKDKNQLESFLRDKLAEKSFPYDEAYWEQAQQQFAEWDQKKKRRRGLLWIFGGLLLCSIGGWTIGQFLEPAPFADGFPMIHSWLAEEPSSEDLSMCADIPHIPTELPDPSSLDSSETTSAIAPQNFLPTDVHGSISEGPMSENIPSFSQKKSKDEIEIGREIGKSKRFPKVSGPYIPSTIDEIEKQTIAIHGIKDQKIHLLPFADRLPPHAELLGKRPSRIRFYMQAGAAVSLSQQVNNTQNTLSLSPAIEAGIRFPIHKGINLSVGLSYFSAPILNTSATMIYRSYDFIVREEEKVWTPEQLHFVGLHVGASTRILPRHEIGVDARLNYLLTTQGTLGETRSTTFESVVDEPTSVWHYRDGLRSWDVQAGLSYQYHLNKRVSMKAAMYHGFRNLTQDARFSPAVKHRNSRLSLSFIYWLR